MLGEIGCGEIKSMQDQIEPNIRQLEIRNRMQIQTGTTWKK